MTCVFQLFRIAEQNTEFRGTPGADHDAGRRGKPQCTWAGYLLSGDKSAVAHSIAQQIGIDTVFSEVTPEGKTDCIRQLCQNGKRVLMVGDGVNDAPALASAEVSLTLPGATDAAREAAGVVLTTSRLTAVPLTIRLARTTMRNIRGNLLWALCYNLVCIPLAACGIMNPSIASAAMSFSSIAVLMHALRLKKAEQQEVS